MSAFSLDRALRQAQAAARKGARDEARQIYLSILNKYPGNARARSGLAALDSAQPTEFPVTRPLQDEIDVVLGHYRRGRHDLAASQASKLVERYPETFLLWNILGAANIALGRVSEAVEALGTAIALEPGNSEARNNLGAALHSLGRHDEALSHFQAAIRIRPDYAEAYCNFAMTLRAMNRSDDAIMILRKAVEITPGNPDAHIALGNLLASQHGAEQAARHLQQAVETIPDSAELHYNLGNLLREAGAIDSAIANYRQAIRITPDHFAATHNLGATLLSQARHGEAAPFLERAVALNPVDPEALKNLGSVLKDLGRLEEAMESYRRAMAIAPADAALHASLAHLYKDLDRTDEALSHYRRALAIKPGYAEIHRALSRITRYRPDDEHLEQMRLLHDSGTLDDEALCHLCFALAKASEDLGQVEQSYRYLEQGNRLRSQALAYDIEKDRKTFQFLKNLDPDTPGVPAEQREITYTPIFILGMPRSGTTLVEQILDTHSEVQGAGELRFFGQSVEKYLDPRAPIDPVTVARIRTSYLDAVAPLARGRKMVTDKMPQNFRFIGLIVKAIPEAKIIHLQRDPRAVCWSNYKQYFSSEGLGYAYDWNDLIEYHALYRDMMDYWISRYPHRIYNLDYEQLTENQEAETRRLLAHLGLEWQQACLEFHRNTRSVRTASQQQVRKEMYTGSSDEWRKFEPFIGGILSALPDVKA